MYFGAEKYCGTGIHYCYSDFLYFFLLGKFWNVNFKSAMAAVTSILFN